MDDIIDYDEKNHDVYDDLNDEYEKTLKKFRTYLTPESDTHISEIETKLPEKHFEINRQKQLREEEQQKEITLIKRKNEEFKNKKVILRDVYTDDQRALRSLRSRKSLDDENSYANVKIDFQNIESYILKSLQKTLDIEAVDSLDSLDSLNDYKLIVFEHLSSRITESSFVLIIYNTSQSSHSFFVFSLSDWLDPLRDCETPNKTNIILYPPNKTKECDVLHIYLAVITKNPFEPVISQKNPFTIDHFKHIGSFKIVHIDKLNPIVEPKVLQMKRFSIDIIFGEKDEDEIEDKNVDKNEEKAFQLLARCSYEIMNHNKIWRSPSHTSHKWKLCKVYVKVPVKYISESCSLEQIFRQDQINLKNNQELYDLCIKVQDLKVKQNSIEEDIQTSYNKWITSKREKMILTHELLQLENQVDKIRMKEKDKCLHEFDAQNETSESDTDNYTDIDTDTDSE